LWSPPCKYYVAKVLRSKRKKWKMKKIYDEKKRKVRKNGRRKKKRKKEREKKWEGNKIKLRKLTNILLGSFCFISYQCLDAKSILKSSNHVQSDNEDFTRASGSSVCYLHMSTYLNVCVSYISLANIYFPWPFWRVSVIPIDLSLNLTLFRMYVLLGLFLTFQDPHKPSTITYE
jgi:hypothetical protein